MELPSNLTTQPENEITDQGFTVEPDYVKISRSEYEDIKNRVSAIERRISVELENAEAEEHSEKSPDHSVKNVQYVYEQTLVEAEPLSPTTDHLARRLSKELKIRRSCDQKVCRSPSARKIGTIRRRSRELEKQNIKLARTQTWHIQPEEKITKVSYTLSSPSINVISSEKRNVPSDRKTSRAASFHATNLTLNGTVSSNGSWMTADEFFSHSGVSENSLENSRSSLAKLRSQNAGMVMAKAKLFDGLTDTKEARKSCRRIGAQRNPGSRSLRTEDKLSTMKNLSPIKRKSRSPNLIKQKQKKENDSDKENMVVQVDSNCNAEKISCGVLKECNRLETPSTNPNIRATPNIKKSLKVKSPRRLCRTPRIATDRMRTPLRAEQVYKNCS